MVNHVCFSPIVALITIFQLRNQPKRMSFRDCPDSRRCGDTCGSFTRESKSEVEHDAFSEIRMQLEGPYEW